MHKLESALQQKIDQTKIVVEDAFDEISSDETIVAWSAGKDSTLMLRLILDVCDEKQIKYPIALDIDQRDQFDELIEHREFLTKKWGIKLLIVRNDDFLSKVKSFGDVIYVNRLDIYNRQALADINFTEDHITWIPDSPVCNHLLKTVPINNALRINNIKAMFTGIRWDEHGAREQETYFSKRSNPSHTRIHPLLHFTERDIWDVTFGLGIPFNSLYKQGYRSLGTKHGTDKNSNIPAWEQDLENSSERENRSAEKEKMMAQLRAWGYM